MATLTTKYNKGDVVYHAGTYSTETWLNCPDCKGELTWMVTFADGHQEELPCQTCEHGYSGPRGKVSTYEWKPIVQALTIGQVSFDDEGPRYMCHETGIGSGTVYYEKDLHDNRTDAEKDAQCKYERQMAHIANLNFRKKGAWAKVSSVVGYKRAEALKQERALKKWLELFYPVPVAATQKNESVDA